MPREVSTPLGAALLVVLSCAAGADDAIAPLAERVRAAAAVVDGQAGQSYTAWNGADPATIVTYTPFAVHRVLRGRLVDTSVILREPGGEVGGARAAGVRRAEFVEGERVMVLLGERDPQDGSYVLGRGDSYRVTGDAKGRLGLDVRLGVDAEAHPSREKGPGTPLTHVPLELFERLARGESIASVEEFEATVASVNPPASVPPAAVASSAAQTPSSRTGSAARLAYVATAVAVILAGLFVWRRRGKP